MRHILTYIDAHGSKRVAMCPFVNGQRDTNRRTGMNTITIFGLVIQQIHLQLATFLLALFGGGGLTVYLWLKRKWDERGNRQLDHHLATITEVSDEVDAAGFRTMRISNLGRPERLENVIRGRHERAWMIAAARNCDWERRFIKDENPAHQERILHVVRNALTDHFKDGEVARLAGLPTKEIDLYFSPTGADAHVGGVRMFRDMVVTPENLAKVKRHGPDKWKFEVDKATGEEQDHRVRVTTLLQMAEALENDCCRPLNGHRVRIVGWMRARVPDYATTAKAA